LEPEIELKAQSDGCKPDYLATICNITTALGGCQQVC